MPPEFAPFLEYGVAGLIVAALIFLGKLYAPHFAALSEGVKALPAALDALTVVMRQEGEEVREGLGEVKAELAVIKDRLPRETRLEPPRVSTLADDERRLLELLRTRPTGSPAGD